MSSLVLESVSCVLSVGVATGTPKPCLCTDASIFTGQTYCFNLTATYDGNHQLTNLTASPRCSLGNYLTCENAAVELPEGTTTQYFPGTDVEGEGLNCTLNSFLPPPPLAPPVRTTLAGEMNYE